MTAQLKREQSQADAARLPRQGERAGLCPQPTTNTAVMNTAEIAAKKLPIPAA